MYRRSAQVDVRSVGRLWRRDRRELAVLALTFCVSVLRTVELAVLAGAVASLAVLLRQLMRPDIHMHSIKVRAPRAPGQPRARVAPTGDGRQ